MHRTYLDLRRISDLQFKSRNTLSADAVHPLDLEPSFQAIKDVEDLGMGMPGDLFALRKREFLDEDVGAMSDPSTR